MEATLIQRTVAAASGFSDLGMWSDAWQELETLSPEDRARPDVLLQRLSILIGLKRWEDAAALAMGMYTNGLRDEAVFLLGAYAIRRHRSLAAAKTWLLIGEKDHGENASVQFNLACYEAQLGDLEAAKLRLSEAIRLNPSMRALALDDEDLAPLWESAGAKAADG